jgi:hypothetical protein
VTPPSCLPFPLYATKTEAQVLPPQTGRLHLLAVSVYGAVHNEVAAQSAVAFLSSPCPTSTPPAPASDRRCVPAPVTSTSCLAACLRPTLCARPCHLHLMLGGLPQADSLCPPLSPPPHAWRPASGRLCVPAPVTSTSCLAARPTLCACPCHLHLMFGGLPQADAVCPPLSPPPHVWRPASGRRCVPTPVTFTSCLAVGARKMTEYE